MDENNTQQSTPEHRRLLDALPFYVNGTLDAAERVWVEAYLKAHPEAAKELRLTEAFRAVVKASQSQVPEDVRIDRLLKAWAKEKPTPAGQAAPAHGWLGKLTEWWRQAWAIPKPLAGFAVVVLVAQMAVLLALLPVSDEAAQYRGGRVGATAGCYDGPGWRIVLDPAAAHAEVLLLLRRADVALVNGPSETGELWLMPRALGDDDAITQMFKASALVEEAVYLPKLQESSCKQR